MDNPSTAPRAGTRRMSLSSRLSDRRSGSPSIQSIPPIPATAAVTSHSERSSICSENLIKHSDLYFADGSIQLRAGNTLFRVHQSQLSRHSCFFRDLFSLPQPVADAGTSPDECPTIELHDSPEDLAHLLNALYDGPTFGDHGYADFCRVAGVLRLSTKYLMDKLRAKALAHLGIAWPSTLKAWDIREDFARNAEMEGSPPYPNPIAVINLAQEIDAPSLLPSAFYDLSRWTYTSILEQWDEEPTTAPLPRATLSSEDMRRLALGKESTQQMITTLIQTMASAQHQRSPQHHHTPFVSHHPSSSSSAMTAANLHHHRHHSRRVSCVSSAACRKDFAELVDLSTQHYLFDRERGSSDPLYVAEELGQLKSAEELGQLKTAEGTEFSECRACAQSLENWALREREKMWKSIPGWFRLYVPGW